MELGTKVHAGFATLMAFAVLVNVRRGEALTQGRSDGVLLTALKREGKFALLLMLACRVCAFRHLGSSTSKILPKPLYLQDTAAEDKDAAVVFFLQSLCTSDGANFVDFSRQNCPLLHYFFFQREAAG